MASASKQEEITPDQVRKTLVKSTKVLADNLSLDNILLTLLSEEAVTQDEVTRIENEITGTDRVKALLKILARKPVSSYKVFMGALFKEREDLYKEVKANENLSKDVNKNRKQTQIQTKGRPCLIREVYPVQTQYAEKITYTVSGNNVTRTLTLPSTPKPNSNPPKPKPKNPSKESQTPKPALTQQDNYKPNQQNPSLLEAPKIVLRRLPRHIHASSKPDNPNPNTNNLPLETSKMTGRNVTLTHRQDVTLLDKSKSNSEHSPIQREFDVMISYQWDAQKQMLLLKNKLEAVGKNVWMDIVETEGDMHKKMADGVLQSKAVLLCFSKKYEDSESCKKEALYADILKKKIIPLKCENHNPSGWLSLLLADNQYFDISNDDALNNSFDAILRVINLSEGQQTSALHPSSTHTGTHT